MTPQGKNRRGMVNESANPIPGTPRKEGGRHTDFMKTNHTQYDIIGDIHGHADPLHALLAKLGYVERDGIHAHPERRVIFLGDFIDRGPKIRETLQTVRAMIDSGNALAVPGNHEFNALAYATPDGTDWLRKHTPKNREQHEATLEQFEGHEAEWQGHLAWFRTLPLWLDLPGLRAVHAAWDTRAAARLGPEVRMTEALVLAASTKGTQEYRDVETLLKGVELQLPDGHFFFDNKNFPRHQIRTRWWLPARGTTYRRIALQPGSNEWEIPELPADAHAERVPGYAADERPVFNGHYWLEGEAELMAPNVAILDYSVAKDGPLTAYRWDGEQKLDAAKFVQVRADGVQP